MNKTIATAICINCQTSNGLSEADRHSIIVMVVLTVIALILCYIGVLWFAIRTRFIPDEKTLIILEDIHTNKAFNDDEVQEWDIVENIQNAVNIIPTTSAVVSTVENEKERY